MYLYKGTNGQKNLLTRKFHKLRYMLLFFSSIHRTKWGQEHQRFRKPGVSSVLLLRLPNWYNGNQRILTGGQFYVRKECIETASNSFMYSFKRIFTASHVFTDCCICTFWSVDVMWGVCMLTVIPLNTLLLLHHYFMCLILVLRLY